MKKLLVLLSMFLALPALAYADGHGMETKVGNLEISHVRARPTLGSMKTTAVFMEIENEGSEDDRLIAVKGDVAMALELHTHIKEGDVMRMRRVENGFVIKAGSEHHLKPGGDHVMVMGMEKGVAVGEKFTITLVFEKAGEVELMVPVKKIEMHH